MEIDRVLERKDGGWARSQGRDYVDELMALPDGRYRIRIEPVTPESTAAVVRRFEWDCGNETIGVAVLNAFTGRMETSEIKPGTIYDGEVRLVPRPPQPAPVPWPWPDVTRVRVGHAYQSAGGGWRRYVEIMYRTDWYEDSGINIAVDELGAWSREESRICTRGPSGEVVVSGEAG